MASISIRLACTPLHTCFVFNPLLHPAAASARRFPPLAASPLRAPATARVSFKAAGSSRSGSINGVETDRLPSDVRERAMSAIDSFGGRVTTGDVASSSGIKLHEAERALQALAADCGGFLEVSEEGDVLYVFPRDYRSKIVARSFRMKVEPALGKLKATSEYLIRVFFGTALIASIILVYTAIIAIASSKSDEDDRGKRGRRSFNSGSTVYFRPSDLFWYWDPYYRRRHHSRDEDGANFVESVFSFVFGDGDPNEGLEVERWKLIGQYITSNGGVVTAEGLAPYLDVSSTKEAHEDEAYILPVLLQFDGHPEVDSEGNILYRFPSLQRTASSHEVGREGYAGKKWAEWVGRAVEYLEEKKWPFSKAGASKRAMVIGLGTLNLFGVIILDSMLKNICVTPKGDGLISFVGDIFPFIQIYASSFFIIPLLRWILLHKSNAEIEKRNHARQRRALDLEFPDPSLRRKLSSARNMAEHNIIGSDKIVYSTEKDIVDQHGLEAEWDQRFAKLEKSD